MDKLENLNEKDFFNDDDLPNLIEPQYQTNQFVPDIEPLIQPEPPTEEELIQGFLNEIENENENVSHLGGLKPSSLKKYQHYQSLFAEFCRVAKKDLNVDSMKLFFKVIIKKKDEAPTQSFRQFCLGINFIIFIIFMFLILKIKIGIKNVGSQIISTTWETCYDDPLNCKPQLPVCKPQIFKNFLYLAIADVQYGNDEARSNVFSKVFKKILKQGYLLWKCNHTTGALSLKPQSLIIAGDLTENGRSYPFEKIEKDEKFYIFKRLYYQKWNKFRIN